MSKVLIGVVPNYNIDSCASVVNIEYLEAVVMAGGYPLIIASLEERDYYDFITEFCDGVILTGSGSDVDPRKYGQEIRPECGQINPKREECDWILLGYVFSKKVPILGICHGLQEMNVYLEGTLYQDIGSEMEGAIEHKQSSSYDMPVHDVLIEDGSIFIEIFDTKRIRVNSRHHQGIKKLGRGLLEGGRSEDGLIEAVVFDRTDHFAIGVQWHPESMVKSDEYSRKIFRYFIQRCAERKRNKRH